MHAQSVADAITRDRPDIDIIACYSDVRCAGDMLLLFRASGCHSQGTLYMSAVGPDVATVARAAIAEIDAYSRRVNEKDSRHG